MEAPQTKPGEGHIGALRDLSTAGRRNVVAVQPLLLFRVDRALIRSELIYNRPYDDGTGKRDR